MVPSYLSRLSPEALSDRVRAVCGLQSPCVLCPRRCGVMRSEGARGFCGGGMRARVYCAGPHHGEEPPLSGTRGSGTVFLSGCTLRCRYCQNYRFSQGDAGAEMSETELAGRFLSLQREGCHNLNLVTPTHYLPQLLGALAMAAREDFSLPVVYNTSGYESVEVLRLLDGIVDIYLPDMRYSLEELALRYSGAADYPAVNRKAVLEMWRQVGGLVTDEHGVALRGLIVRHLVLPGGISGTAGVMQFLSHELGRGVAVSLMSQYTPCYRAEGDPQLGRRITRKEYERARLALEEHGLHKGWVQEWKGDDDDRYLGARFESNV